MFDVLALGGINLDFVLRVARFPSSGQKVGANFVGRFPGGPVGNFACAASRLGARVAAVAVIGDDDNGSLVIGSFEDFGVDASFVTKSCKKETPITLIAIEPSGERVIYVPEFDDRVPLDLLARALPQAKALYMMPRDIDYFFEAAALARRQGIPVMVDIEPTLPVERNDLKRMAPLLEVISFNEDGFQKVFAQQPNPRLLQELLGWGPRAAVVTLGERGALGADRESVVVQESFRVPVTDTTGAGDTFNAALFTGLMGGQALAPSIQFACAAAAISITALGGRGHLPTRAEVRAFLAASAGNPQKHNH